MSCAKNTANGMQYRSFALCPLPLGDRQARLRGVVGHVRPGDGPRQHCWGHGGSFKEEDVCFGGGGWLTVQNCAELWVPFARRKHEATLGHSRLIWPLAGPGVTRWEIQSWEKPSGNRWQVQMQVIGSGG